MDELPHNVLVIDDLRRFRFGCIYARTAEQAETFLFDIGAPWKQVWFDYDLGLVDGSPTTREIVRRMEEMAHNGQILPIEKVYVHTANPAGRAEIVAALSGWYDVTVVDANDYLAPGERPMYYVLRHPG